MSGISQFSVDGLKKTQAAEKIQKEREEANEKQRKKDSSATPRQETVRKAMQDRDKATSQERTKVEERDKQRKMIKIHKYLTNPHFAFLKDIALKPLAARPTYDEVCFFYDQIRQAIDSKNATGNVKKYAVYGVGMVEKVWGDGSQMTMLPQEFRFNLTNAAMYYGTGVFDQMLDPILTEIAIEYPVLASAGLMRRASEMFLYTMAMVDKMNKTPGALEGIQQMQEPAAPEEEVLGAK